MTLKNRYLILALALIISSCSSIADMQFWKSDDVEDDPTKPAELKEFKNEVDINIAWVSKFKNEDNIGDFKPAFSSGKIFSAKIVRGIQFPFSFSSTPEPLQIFI